MMFGKSTIWECPDPHCDWWQWGRKTDYPGDCPQCGATLISDPWAAAMTAADEEYRRAKDDFDIFVD